MRESILAEQTHAFVRAQPWQAAVLPFGATEPHNLHMPYGTDTFQVEDAGPIGLPAGLGRRRPRRPAAGRFPSASTPTT